MSQHTRCAARAIGSDEMHCATCRLTWDRKDPEPPVCGRAVAVSQSLAVAASTPVLGVDTGWVKGFVSGLPLRTHERR